MWNLQLTSRVAGIQNPLMGSRAGTSPPFWTRGLASLGLAVTRGLASQTEELFSFKITPSVSRSEQ